MSRKTTRNRAYQQMYAIMNARGTAKRYKTFKPDRGVIELLIDSGGGQMEYAPLDELANEIIKVAHAGKDIDIGPSEARPMAHWWAVINHDQAGLKELPAPIGMRSDGRMCFHRLPFDYMPYEKHKPPMHFLEFCGRCSDPLVLQAFIGSLFMGASYRQQYLYLFGEGNDGKGTLFNLLERMLGQTFTGEDVPEKISPFWSSGLIGKRLCVFPDLENPNFPVSPRFRKLTGDDPIRVEEKFKKSYNTKIFTKFIFASNDELQMTAKKADQRRALYIALESFKGPTDTSYLEKLWAEVPAIFALCIDTYRRLCPDDGPIPQNIKEPIDFQRSCENEAFFSRYFNNSPSGQITGAQWQRAMADYFRRRPTDVENRILLNALKEKGCIRKRISSGYIIKGISMKSGLQVVHEGGLWPSGDMSAADKAKSKKDRR
jgi:hypothetical protein